MPTSMNTTSGEIFCLHYIVDNIGGCGYICRVELRKNAFNCFRAER